jgi:hypothetical protein
MLAAQADGVGDQVGGDLGRLRPAAVVAGVDARFAQPCEAAEQPGDGAGVEVEGVGDGGRGLALAPAAEGGAADGDGYRSRHDEASERG